MKLAFTVSNGIHYINVGGEVERVTYLMDIPDESLPPYIRDFLAERNSPDETTRRQRWYESMSISIVEG